MVHPGSSRQTSVWAASAANFCDLDSACAEGSLEQQDPNCLAQLKYVIPINCDTVAGSQLSNRDDFLMI